MLSNARGSTPTVFLITDGAVEDERQICNSVKNSLKDGGSKCPRIYTFGIGNGATENFPVKTWLVSYDHKQILLRFHISLSTDDFRVASHN